MLGNFFKKIFGSRNERIIKRLRRQVDEVNRLESALTEQSDTALQEKSQQLRRRHGDGETLEQLLPEAFALVRESSKRVLGMRHFDEQLIGAMVLHQNKISEMRTGEGKTLVATLSVYLNALAGKGVHVVTVNDYLASRDAEWMGRLYNFLGLSVGTIVANMDQEARRAAYAADITYGTNNEFGFDYLRDNMASDIQSKVQRVLNYAIVDEVDSILIDEARTPLIISGPSSDSSEIYQKIDKLIPDLRLQTASPAELEQSESEVAQDALGDYTLDEKGKQVLLTESGHDHVEQLLVEQGLLQEDESLYDPSHIGLLHHLNAGLRAHAIFQRDVDYIVSGDQIVIIDEFTGRKMPGRRWSEGLHQAVEAKEGVKIQQENQTIASITFQNYFRLYDKLAGMTGTADTEAFEFQQIYGLEVVVIPTHRPMVRIDSADLIYLGIEDKFDAIIQDILDCVARKQPVLVGTASIENSELLSKHLDEQKIPHQVLNAKQHESEARIISEAGLPGAITIATNMAGRGTDIVLGGNLEAELAQLPNTNTEADRATREAATEQWQKRHEQVLAAGGLHIIGTERHESRRIDNQLRGRSGRQGDPGSSRFYLSLQDNLLRIFASDRVSSMMQKFGMEKGEAIEHPWLNKTIANAQRKVEAHNFDIRKHLLEYDDVANDQRKVIYQQRNEILVSDDISDVVIAMRRDIVQQIIDRYLPPDSMDERWDVAAATEAIESQFGQAMPLQAWLDEDDEMEPSDLTEKAIQLLTDTHTEKERLAGNEGVRFFEKHVMLNRLDYFWKEHLANMDYLRQSVGLRSYAQKNPKQEYKRESFDMFANLLEQIKVDVTEVLAKVEVRDSEQVRRADQQMQQEQERINDSNAMRFQHASAQTPLAAEQQREPTADERAAQKATPFVRDKPKVGRNDPCWCGSGKKFKKCHGQLH